MQMLMFRGDWQAALPKLTELGNGLALITSLDAVLGAHGDAVSMQLAPMLGVSVSSAGHLQRMVCTDVLLCVWTCSCMYECALVCMDVLLYVWMCTCMYGCALVCVHVLLYVCMCSCMYACALVSQSLP